MRVLFLNPSRSGQGTVPINIALLMSCLINSGHTVRLFDFSDYACFTDTSYEDIFFKKTEFDNKGLVKERKAFFRKFGYPDLQSSELRESNYRDDFHDCIINFSPELIAVSCLSADFAFACNFLKPFKEMFNIPIIFGGIHAILLPQEVIQTPVCDFVCIGEGENTIVELCNSMEKNIGYEKVKGLWYKLGGEIYKNQPIHLTDLDNLPFLNYDYFDPIHFYKPFDGKRYKMINYELSRGCHYNCTYCVNSTLKKTYKGLGKFRRIKNFEQSISELEYLINKYNFDFIRFWDDDFTALKNDQLGEYASLYIQRIGLPFLIYARAESINEAKVRILKEMGCKTLAMGIESGNEFIRRTVMNRQVSNETIISKFALIKSFGIRVSAYNIIGLPYETRRSIFDTIELNRIIDPDSFSVTLLEPYRGTKIRIMCEEQGLDHNVGVDNPSEFSHLRAQFVPPGMTKDEIEGLFKTFPFYVKFSKELYKEIALAETDEGKYIELLNKFNELKN
jgi:anaerobic magnesium-protoporphyrin IX monomethyl ester cyclase